LRRFIREVRGDRLYAAWLAAATTGLRRGEVLGLMWTDVDFDKGRLSVRRARVSSGGVVVLSEPKTRRSRRVVALDQTTTAALREHRTRQLEERLAWGAAWVDTGFVFTREDGTPLHPESLSKMFQWRVRRAGLPRIRFHDLRHTHATLALQAGVHPKVVSERLGHSSIRITLDTYSHAIPAMQEEAAERIAALIFDS
jgi:integrase